MGESTDLVGRFREEILAFLKNRTAGRIEEAREKLKRASEERRAAANRKYKARIRLAELRSERELVSEKALRSRNFGEEFEAIMRMKGTRKIESFPPNKLIVRSKRIFQYVEATKTEYDIGQNDMIIMLDPSGIFRRTDISFVKGNYPGKFYHPHAQEQNTCFGIGSAKDGLNEGIDKLVASFEVVPLVHLLLSFLRRDNQKPGQIIPSPGDEYHESADWGYQSDEERGREKAAFIELCQAAYLGKLTRLADDAVRSTEDEISKAADAFIKARDDEEELRLVIDVLEKKIDANLPNLAEMEGAALAADERIKHIRRQEEKLIISFAVSDILVALEISPDQPPKIQRPSEAIPLGQRFTEAGYMKRLEENTEFGRSERKRIIRLQAEGAISAIFEFFADALEKSWGIIKGGGPQNG